MSSSFGNALRLTLFGQSHSEGIGAVLDGLPAGETIDMELVQAFLARRAPGQSALTTQRVESDTPTVLSGLWEGKTCGAPLCAVFPNADVRSADYAALRDVPRPGHADFPAHMKFSGHNDIRGGGHFSARLTAPLCFAGAVAMQILARRGIHIGAHIASIGPIADSRFDPVNLHPAALLAPGKRPISTIDAAAAEAMAMEIEAARRVGDSVGGTVECGILGLPVGLGAPIFDGLENRLAAAVFAIPAVKGIEFGAGFAAASMRGSENNDAYYYEEDRVKTRTNRHGGILGGLSSGMPLLFRAAFKPTPSIAQTQDSVRLSQKESAALQLQGRHDPCVVLRAVPCVEAAAAVVILDAMLSEGRL